MIISHRYRFIFLKTLKTASTSIEIALSKYCGPQDVITWIAPEDEKVRRALGYLGPQNCGIPVPRYTVKDWLLVVMQRKRLKYYNHMPARRVRSGIGRHVWDSYYKFCFERNPWDRVVSLYFWKNRNRNPRPTFGEFLQNANKYSLSNWYIYAIREKIVIDHVGLYEDLELELERIAERLMLPGKLLLPRAKSGYREDQRRYWEIIGEAEREVITKICSREIAHFGYDF